MLFERTKLPGAYVITFEPINDERGFFLRSFCKDKLKEQDLKTDFVQCNISYNHKKGTVRGLHYQIHPHAEVKIVLCRRGAIYDVMVDIRKGSPTYGQWFGLELSADNYKALYVPEGFAHGYQTLDDDTEVFYYVGNYYSPEASKGILWNDPTIGIRWPHPATVISERDKNLPGLIA